MEARFHLMLLDVERLAILANNKAVPRHTQVYMFGATPGSSSTWRRGGAQQHVLELALGLPGGARPGHGRVQGLTRAERERFGAEPRQTKRMMH